MAAEQERYKNKWLAAAFAVFLGGWGVHKFYLGHWKLGIAYVVVTLILGSWVLGLGYGWAIAGLTGLWSIILIAEGLLYATRSPERFHQIYVEGRRPIF